LKEQIKQINFLWTLSPPDKKLPLDFYSARWTGSIQSPKTGTFKIGLDGNDGFRLYINNKPVIDNWIKTKLIAHYLPIIILKKANSMLYASNFLNRLAMLI
jgi:beta-glucosidase